MSDDAGTTDRGRLIGGRYRVTGTLGHGGMATVFRAVDEQLGREVAVKVFRIGPVDHGERARAEGEIRVLAQLRSPALVTLYDADIADADGDSYLVMELVPGTDLATRLKEGPLDRTTAANVGAQVAEGLAAVHAAGIVHRDVKPANVLLEDNGTAKLADFGIALLRDSARVTGTGLVMGTAAYLAPEQVTAQEVTGAADVYALGLLLLEALTGRQTFPGSAMESATARLVRGPEIDPSLPVAWRTLLHTMTAQDPTERPTAVEAAERLRALGRVVDDGAAPTQLLPGGPGGVAGAAAAAGVVGAAAGAAAAGADDRTAVLGTQGAASAGPDDVATTALPRTQRQPAVPVGATAGTGGAGRAGTVPPDRPGPAGSEPRRSRAGLVWTIVAVVVALVVIAVIVVLALNRNTPATAPTDTTSTSTSSVPSVVPSAEPSTEPSAPAEPSQQPSVEPSQPTEPSQEPSVPTTPAPTVPEATPGTAATTG
jgi:tRNA A-37 threonylcarbamoyl transferase component Bud32